MPHDVFISYSSKDKVVTDAICRTLEANGIRCWMAPRDIDPGQSYAGAIIDAISAAKVFLLVFSSSANASTQVERELERAAAKKLKIVPIRIENVPPAKEFEYWISSPHWLDAYTKPIEPHLQKLVESVRRSLGLADSHASRKGEPPPPAAAGTDSTAKPDTPAASRLSQRAALLSGLATLVLTGLVVALIFAERDSHKSSPTTKNTSQTQPERDALSETAQMRDFLRGAEQALEKCDELPKHEHDAAWINKLIAELRERRRKVAALSEGDAPARRLHFDNKVVELLGEYDRGLKDLDRQRQELELNSKLSELDSAIGDAARFAATLASLAQDFPNASTAANLNAVARDEPIWRGVQSWNEFLARKSFSDPALSPAAAAALIVDGDRLRHDAAISPFCDEYDKRRDNLTAIAHRVDLAERPIIVGLRDYLSDHWMHDLYVVQLKSGELYYLDQDPTGLAERPGGGVELQYIVNSRRETKRTKLSSIDIRFRGRAPHCELANEVLQSIESESQLLTSQWVPTFCTILQRIAADNSADPVPRELIFKETYQVAAQGSAEITLTFAKQAACISEQKIDSSVAWFNPSDPRAANERKKAEEFFRTLPPVSIAAKDALALFEKRQLVSPLSFRWIGWLRPDPDHGWMLACQRPPGSGSKLFVIADNGNQRLAMQEIGEMGSGNVRWQPTTNLFGNGRPLFIREQSP